MEIQMAINDHDHDHFRDMMITAAYIQGCNPMAADDGWFVVVLWAMLPTT